MSDWRPGASPALLAARARLLSDMRQFFQARGVMEVETPLLASSGATDPTLSLFSSAGRWLQTSPEYAMKRLLAAGSGPIFQVCKAFRAGECGRLHNPEFTLLEWYRPGWDYRALMEEVGELAASLLDRDGWQTLSYRDSFLECLDLDPFTANEAALAALARERLEVGFERADRDTWLDLLLTHCVEPTLPHGLVFLADYPASQAALARVAKRGDVAVAERFELYVDRIEIANGYSELTDVQEQARRLRAEQVRLEARGETGRLVDPLLLAALDSGLPDCAGVALGLDRLLALQQGCGSLDEVISFSWERT